MTAERDALSERVEEFKRKDIEKDDFDSDVDSQEDDADENMGHEDDEDDADADGVESDPDIEILPPQEVKYTTIELSD